MTHKSALIYMQLYLVSIQMNQNGKTLLKTENFYFWNVSIFIFSFSGEETWYGDVVCLYVRLYL